MTLSYEGYLEGHFAGVEEFLQKGIIAISPEDFARRSPPVGKPAALSARGLVTLARLEKCSALTVHERLASALPDRMKEPEKEFTWDIRQLPNAPDEVVVQARKLTEYLLSTEHKDGGGKAKFFETNLGIKSEDWQYLQAQLVDALSSTPLDDVSLDQYGIRFNALLPVHGRNRRIATIRTGWIVRRGERASLVTAYPADKKPDPALNVQEPAVVDHRLAGDKRWEAIFALACEAGESAALACVPRPLKVVGYPVEMEGNCGCAYVRVPNARTGFARWRKMAGHASSHHRSGVCFYSVTESQSAERAKAYAEAFAKVLRRTGIECSVETYFT
jgi:hypothetical protein